MADGDGFGSQFSTPDSSAPPPAAPQDGGFGSGFGAAVSSAGKAVGKLFGGPQYTPPDPATSALDQSADLLQQRIKSAGSVATNPLIQFFDPDGVKAARDFMPQATQQLQQIEQQRQRAADIRSTARNWGLTNPNQFGYQATDTTLANEALRQWKDEGNFNAYKALSGASPEWKNRADLYMPDAMAKFGQHVEAVQRGMTTLNAAATAGSEVAYKAARDKVIKENDLQAIGVKSDSIPQTLEEWTRVRGSLQTQYNQASRTLMAFNARQDQLNQAVPITDEKVGSRIEGTYQFANGEGVPGFKAVTLPGYGDVQGVMGPPGSRDTANRGVTWSNAAPEQIKTVREQMNADEVKGAISKYKMSRDFFNTANNDKLYKSAAGLALISDELGAIGRDVAEGSKAAGSIGLTKMLEAKYGTIDKARNRLETERAALKEWLGKPPQERLSPPSIEGIKEVARFKHGEALMELSDRISQPMETAGRYGMVLKNLGLDKEVTENPQLRATYDSALKAGNREIDSYPMVTIGDRRVMLPTGSNVPGAKVAPLDHGSDSPSSQTGGPEPAVPSSQPSGPNSPAAPNGGQPPPGPVGAAPGSGGAPAQPPTGGIPVNYAEEIKKSEGFKQRAEWDYKQFTNGYGTRAAHSTEAIDKPTAERRFNEEMSKASAFVDKVNPNLDPGTRAALASLTFNSGEKWAQSGLGEKVRAGDLAGAKAAFLQYNKAGGEVNQGLASRRVREARWFGQGSEADQAAEARNVAANLLGNPQSPREVAKQVALGGDQAAEARNVAAMRTGRSPTRAATTTLADVGNAAAEHAPAIGSTIGALGGGVAGGPAGAVGGGAVGGGAGQWLKDYLLGNPQSPREIAKQVALGGVLGVAPEGRPYVGAAARALGVGAVEGADTLAKGGDAVDAGEVAVTGAGAAAIGEGFGRALGMVGHKIYSLFTNDAQKTVRAAAADLHAANETLKTEQPKLPGVAGAAATANPKYEAAEKAKEKAELTIKEMMPSAKPDEVAYAHKVASEGVPRGEAEVSRPGATEKEHIGAGYRQLEREVGNKGVGAPKASPKLTDGPIAAVENKQVSAKHAELAERTEAAITAPAKDWQSKWTQLKDVRSALLDAERDAMTSTALGRTQTAKDMRTLADTVRTQQAKVANAVFGPTEGPKVIDRLRVLDTRYRRLMEATNGGDMAAAARMTGEAGRTADRTFRAFAQDDRAAIAAWDAMRRKGPDVEKDIRTLVGAEKIPVLGHVISAVKLVAGYNQWRAQRAAGGAARFEDFVPELKEAVARRARGFRDVGGTVGARAAVSMTE